MQRVAVDHHDRRAHQQRRDQRVPHHPGGGGEPQDPVARPEVPAQRVVLQVLQQDPAVAVHDRLRLAGGAGGEQHAQRVGERHRVERELAPGSARSSLHGDRVGQRVRAVGHVHDVLDGRAARRGSRPPARGGRRPCCRSRSRRPPAGPSARSGRTGRPRCAHRTPARSSPTPRPGWRWRGRRPASRGCSAGRPPPGRPGRRRAAAARRGPGRPGRAAAPRSARRGRGSASSASTATVGRVGRRPRRACSA